MPPTPQHVHVPPGYPTATVFLDESGSKGKDLFTIGGLKVRKSGLLARNIKDARDRHNFHGELKFQRLNQGSLPFALELIDLLAGSDAHLVATVINPANYDPFRGGVDRWKAHAEIASQLLVGSINRRELISVLLDGISTPRGCSLADTIRDDVNRRLGATSVVSATCLDSRTNDCLQVADLIASSIAFERRRAAGRRGDPASPKGIVAARLGVAFGNVGLRDGRGSRSRIATLRTARRKDATVTLLTRRVDSA